MTERHTPARLAAQRSGARPVAAMPAGISPRKHTLAQPHTKPLDGPSVRQGRRPVAEYPACRGAATRASVGGRAARAHTRRVAQAHTRRGVQARMRRGVQAHMHHVAQARMHHAARGRKAAHAAEVSENLRIQDKTTGHTRTI